MKAQASGVQLVGQKSLVPDKAFIKAFILYKTEKCRNCGRPLRSDRSIAIGFGPTCAMDFAARWIKHKPAYLGERAKKNWSEDEVRSLVTFARNVKVV